MQSEDDFDTPSTPARVFTKNTPQNSAQNSAQITPQTQNQIPAQTPPQTPRQTPAQAPNDAIVQVQTIELPLNLGIKTITTTRLLIPPTNNSSVAPTGMSTTSVRTPTQTTQTTPTQTTPAQTTQLTPNTQTGSASTSPNNTFGNPGASAPSSAFTPASAPAPASGPRQRPVIQNNKNIAVLLPLEGPLKNVGNAIRSGFLQASSQEKNPESLNIQFYDTNNKNISELYDKAVSDGATLIIGPLTKDALAQLHKRTLTTTTLALNSLPNPSSIPLQVNLFEFDLSPTDEAEQVAITAFDRGARSAMVIAPETELGKRLFERFKTAFEKAGGHVQVNAAYNSKTVLKKLLHDALGYNDSYEKHREVARLSGRDLKTIPRIRQDIDMVFIVASPEMGRQINPMLKYYYAGHLPTYATSMIFSGVRDPAADNDLNGIIFTEMPWVIAQSITATDRYQRFYAMGLDAFAISKTLARMVSSPSSSVPGATGDLYLGKDQEVIRRLRFARFSHGNPVAI